MGRKVGEESLLRNEMKYIVEYYNKSIKDWVAMNRIQSETIEEAEKRVALFQEWDSMAGITTNKYRITQI